jgi:hypothetical protein
MTLIAGMPQFSCICPNGSTKPVCVSLATDSSGCCCGGGKCCSPSQDGGACCCKPVKIANADRSTHKSCCEEHRSQKPDQKQGLRPEAGQKCCTKVLSPRPVTAVSYHKTVVIPKAFLEAQYPQSLALSSTWLATTYGRTLWQINLLAPPTDLVEALQRYLI